MTSILIHCGSPTCTNEVHVHATGDDQLASLLDQAGWRRHQEPGDNTVRWYCPREDT